MQAAHPVSFVAIFLAVLLTIVVKPNHEAFAYSPKLNSSSSKQTLHRADFRIEGSSCVSCLRRVAKALSTSTGVLKADVSIFRPYWALVIYNSKQTSLPTILKSTKKEKVKIVDIEDTQIAQMPIIIIPKGLSAKQATINATVTKSMR